MTLPAQRSHRPGANGIAPPLLLTAVLVAVAVLFVQTWSGLDERRAFAERERQGVEFLRSLNQVTMALIDMQTATAAGQAASRDALNEAVEGATSADARFGAELRTRERWAGVRAKIEALPERGLARPPQEIYDAYSETGALLLALYAKVRESSGLIRDPDADAHHLQDSAAEELPEALVAAGRLVALARLTATRGPDDQLRTAIELSTARSAVLEPAENLVAGLQAAVDNTESRQLSGNLLRHLDGYQQAVEALATAAGTDESRRPDPEQIEAARITAQGVAAKLVEVMLAELDGLIVARLDGVTGQRRLAGAASAGGLLLGLGLAYLLLAPRRRPAPRLAPPMSADPAASGATAGPTAGAPASHPEWSGPATTLGGTAAVPGEPGRGPVGISGGGRNRLSGQPEPGNRSDRPARWGRSDVAR